MIQLSSKERAFLRKLAHNLDPIVRIGKDGIDENVINSIAEVVKKRELIKVSILQNCEEDKDVVAELLSERTSSELVQVIGHTIVLYKQSSKEKYRKIELVK